MRCLTGGKNSKEVEDLGKFPLLLEEKIGHQMDNIILGDFNMAQTDKSKLPDYFSPIKGCLPIKMCNLIKY